MLNDGCGEISYEVMVDFDPNDTIDCWIEVNEVKCEVFEDRAFINGEDGVGTPHYMWIRMNYDSYYTFAPSFYWESNELEVYITDPCEGTSIMNVVGINDFTVSVMDSATLVFDDPEDDIDDTVGTPLNTYNTDKCGETFVTLYW